MLDIQTTHQDNHTAQLKVKVDAERLEKAMRATARSIAKKVRIRGFRPGKAPYNVILNLYGRDAILGETLEKIGNDIYREALEASDIEPYAMGSLEEFTEDDGLEITFVVPKRPEIDLGSYRDDLRVEYEEPEVTDEMVDETMENLRQNQALLEDVDRPAKLGDQVIFGHIAVDMLPLDSEEEDNDDETGEDNEGEDGAGEDTETEEADTEETEDAEEPAAPETIIHQHNWERVLDDDPERDLFPGFSAEIVGLSTNDEKTFTLVLPDDFDEEEMAGRTLSCEVHIEQVQARTVPEWSDDLAKRISDEEQETILELRMEVRQQLQQQLEHVANQELIEEALDQLVEGATLHYPEAVVEEHLDDLMAEMDRNLQQQGLRLEDFLRITGQEVTTLREQYREEAVRRAERSLVLVEMLRAEELAISDEDVDTEIDRLSAMMGEGEQREQFKELLRSPQTLMNVTSQLANDRILSRLAAIAKGENPPIGPVKPEEDNEEAEAGEEMDTAEDAAADAEVAEEAAPAAEASEEDADDAKTEVKAEIDDDTETASDTDVENGADEETD